MTEEEHILTGGNMAAAVVQAGATVRKPVTMATPSVKGLLDFLHNRHYPASPQHFGTDEQGRQSLEFVPGVMGNAGPTLTLVDLERVGRLIRQLHNLTADFPIPPDAHWDVAIRPDHEDLICHHDLAPWNLVREQAGGVVSGDVRWVFIDWDNAGPGSRLWDLAYAAITFPPIEPECDVQHILPRVRALVQGYRLSANESRSLPSMMRRRAQAGGDLLVHGHENGIQPWARMYADGHAKYWFGAAEFIEQHQEALHAACEKP